SMRCSSPPSVPTYTTPSWYTRGALTTPRPSPSAGYRHTSWPSTSSRACTDPSLVATNAFPSATTGDDVILEPSRTAHASDWRSLSASRARTIPSSPASTTRADVTPSPTSAEAISGVVVMRPSVRIVHTWLPVV